jgi:hypothetical protein
MDAAWLDGGQAHRLKDDLITAFLDYYIVVARRTSNERELACRWPVKRLQKLNS